MIFKNKMILKFSCKGELKEAKKSVNVQWGPNLKSNKMAN